jgi:hypothetical protein
LSLIFVLALRLLLRPPTEGRLSRNFDPVRCHYAAESWETTNAPMYFIKLSENNIKTYIEEDK